MNKYTIYCTTKQTEKAFKLGAHVEEDCSTLRHDASRTTYINDRYYSYPTAEQMLGWLEERDIIEEIEVGIYEDDKWTYMVHLKNNPARVNHTLYNSRKEATLAAIDAALEYLSNNKN